MSRTAAGVAVRIGSFDVEVTDYGSAREIRIVRAGQVVYFETTRLSLDACIERFIGSMV